MLKAGQALLLNNRRWHLRQVRPVGARGLALEAIGASAAAMGMTRLMTAVRYGDELFIEQSDQRYWYAHLQQDWVEDEQGPALRCQAANRLDLLDAHTRYPASGDLKNRFSWSYSRAARYRHCPRAYYYHYYAAWEGWRNEAPAPVRQTYLLKNLTDRSLWVGNLVHESIRLALARLRDGQTIPGSELISQMHARARRDFEDSHSERYPQRPNQRTGFQEHYYNLDLPKSTWQSAWAEAEQLLQTFLHSELYADLRRQPPSGFLNIEELQSFPLAGTRVWVQIDLARQAGGLIYLYDWKTGPIDASELHRQLGVYGLYARHTWSQAAEPDMPLRGIVYLLAEDRLLDIELDQTLLQEAQTEAESSIAHLRGLLRDADSNLAELHRFPMIDDLSICRQCQFRELCGRDGA